MSGQNEANELQYYIKLPMLCVVCSGYTQRYLLRNQTNLDNGILHTDPKSTTLGPQLIFISKKPPFEPRPVSVFKAGENACKDCF